MNSAPSRSPKWALPILVASLLLAGGVFWLARANQKLEAEMVELKDQLVYSRQDRAQSEGILEALRSPEALRVTLSPSAAPSSQPRLDAVYAPRSGRLVVIAANLAPVPADRTYQLWLQPKSGAPIPAGTFIPDTFGHAVYTMGLAEGTRPTGFTVTVEPKAGSVAPTMPNVLTGRVGSHEAEAVK